MICGKSGVLACRGCREVAHWGACKDVIKRETEAVGALEDEEGGGVSGVGVVSSCNHTICRCCIYHCKIS